MPSIRDCRTVGFMARSFKFRGGGIQRVRFCFAALAIGILAIEGAMPVLAYDLKIVNTADHVVEGPVTLRINELPEKFRKKRIVARGANGTVLPSQKDDLTGDGRANELAFRIEVPAHSARRVTLKRSPSTARSTREMTREDRSKLMWSDIHLENRALLWHLPGYWEQTAEQPYRFPPDVPPRYDPRDIFEVRDRHNNQRLLGFTLKPEQEAYVVEDVSEHVTAGPVRGVVTRVREVRPTEQKGARLEVVHRLEMPRHERRIDIEIGIRNTGERSQDVSDLRVLDGEMGNDLEDLDGDLDNLHTPSERRAQAWINEATGFGMAYIPHQPDLGWRQERVGSGYFRFAGGPGSKVRLGGLRSGGELDPGEETRFRFSFVFYNEQDPRAAREQFLRDVYEVPGALGIYKGDGKVLQVANGPLYIIDGLQNLDRWGHDANVRTQRKPDGVKVTASEPGTGIFTGFARDFGEPTELRGEATAISENTALQVVIVERQTGEMFDLGTVEGEFSLNLTEKLPLDGLTKGLLHLRPVPQDEADQPTDSLSVRLKGLTMSWPTPQPPELRWPREGQPLSDVGVALEMRSRDGSERGYEIQVARDKAFKEPVIEDTQEMTTGLKFEGQRTKYLPDKLPDEGDYYWRVRPLDSSRRPGAWTEPKRFVVDDTDRSKAELIRPITPSRPAHFITGMGGNKSRRQLLETLREQYSEEMADLFIEQRSYSPDEEYPIPIFAATSSQPTLPQIEYAFRNEPKVLGIVFAEYGFDPAYLERVLALAAKYGRYVSALNLGLDIMQQSVLTEEFYPLMEAYGAYVLPQQKQNNRRDQLARVATELGAYLTGRVGAWGTETEYGFSWKPMSWSRWERGHHIDHPQNWMPTYIMGLSIGASLYRTEAFSNAKFADGWLAGRSAYEQKTDFGPLWKRAMGPFFEDMLKYDLVPTREEILEKVRAGIAGKPEYGLTRPSSPATLFPNRVFGAVHGLPFEGVPTAHILENTWTPDWPDFYVVPMLPAYLPPKEERLFETVIDAESFEYPEDAVAHLRQYYPPTRSEAYAVRVGDTGVVLNSIDERRDPRSGTQDFHLELSKGPVETVQGRVDYQAYLLMKQTEDVVFIHANNFKTRYMDVTLESRHGRRLALKEITPDTSVITSRQWNAESGELRLVLNFHKGVPRFEVTAR